MNAPGSSLSFQSSSGCEISSRARIGHVNLRVANIDRAADFYRDVLGFTVTCYGPGIGLPIVFLALGDYHHHVALNWFYDGGRTASSIRPGGLNHFAIVHPDELSLAKAVERVLLHGELIEDSRDHGSTLSIYLRDPDGNGIELYCDRPRSQWFDAMGELVLRSEPIHMDKWLTEVLARKSSLCFIERFPRIGVAVMMGTMMQSISAFMAFRSEQANMVLPANLRPYIGSIFRNCR